MFASIAGKSSALRSCIELSDSPYVMITRPSSVASVICSFSSFLIKSEKNFPGTQIAPSSKTSALILRRIEISPSVAISVIESFSAVIFMHSRIGLVVFVLHAFATFSTASDNSIPSQMIFISSSSRPFRALFPDSLSLRKNFIYIIFF